jgi:hypothetical protein
LASAICVFGGASAYCISAFSTVETYNFKTDTWMERTEISNDSVMTTAPSLDSAIYVRGGTFQMCPPSVRKTVRVYNPQNDFLTFIKDVNIPSEGRLFQNYPNPFNPVANIQYHLDINSNVTLSVYDILGQKVKDLVNGLQSAGIYKISFNVEVYQALCISIK